MTPKREIELLNETVQLQRKLIKVLEEQVKQLQSQSHKDKRN